MTINGYNFIYGGRSLNELGVFKCNIGGLNTETNDEEVNIITSTTPFKDTWDFHGMEKSTPLQFKITIAKSNGEFINAYEQRELKKWLCKNKRDWLFIDQNDLADIWYNCVMINPRPVNVGIQTAGLEFTCICDTNHAWSKLYLKKYKCSGELILNLNMSIDYDEYILYPVLTINPKENGDIFIKNNTINKYVSIKNCKTSEVIIMDGGKDIIQSSINRILLDDWNKNFLELINGVNNIQLSGNFDFTLEYRLPIRVGG